MIAALLALWSGVAAARTAVVVLRSDDLPVYSAPIESFTRELGIPIQVMDLRGDKSQALRAAQQLQADPPPLIFALGAKAAYIATQQLPQVPLIYAMVVDPARYGIEGIQVTGISMQVPPDMVLAQFQLFAPRVKRIGLLVSSDNSDPNVGAAIEAARSLGYKVTARRVTPGDDLRRSFSALRREVDAIWLLPDSHILTPANFRLLQQETRRSRMPLLVYSEALVEAGALFCVAPDYANLGGQAAVLAQRILNGENPGAITPEAPTASRVVLNRETQDAIGLKVEASLLDFVDSVVHEPTRR